MKPAQKSSKSIENAPSGTLLSLSVIIPTLNEELELPRSLARVVEAEGCEIITVDCGSQDRTREIATNMGTTVIESLPGRGRQMNAGASAASGEVLLFLHADTRLPPRFEYCVSHIMQQSGVSGGAFSLRIDSTGLPFRVIEWVVSYRSRFFQLPYGDQALFMRASTFKRIGGFPDWPIMEDYALVRKLRRVGRLETSRARVLTSARRWREGGVWRTTIWNQVYLLSHLLGVSPNRTAHWRRGRSRAPAQASSSTAEHTSL